MHDSAARCMAIALLATAALAGCGAPRSLLDPYRRYIATHTERQPQPGEVKATFLGTTTLLFDDGETQLMIDGFFSRPPMAKVATSQIETDMAAVDAALSRAGVDRLKALFVAHSHYDHVLDAAYVIRRTGAKLYGSASTLNVGRGGGLTDKQMELYESGRELPLGRFSVTVLSSRHSPPIPGLNDDLGQVIDAPLRQPAGAKAYKEGGAFDFLIRHDGRSILVKPSAHYVEGALDHVRAEALFLATAALGVQERAFQEAFYKQTVATVRPRLVVPIHWDNFFQPLTDQLEPLDSHDFSAGFQYLEKRLANDRVRFCILQGYGSVMLFDQDHSDQRDGDW